jgi:hypothetical protein
MQAERNGQFIEAQTILRSYDTVPRPPPPLPLPSLKVHKIENFFDSDFGIRVISLLVMTKY